MIISHIDNMMFVAVATADSGREGRRGEGGGGGGGGRRGEWRAGLHHICSGIALLRERG